MNERILGLVLATSAKDGVFQNVGYSRGVSGRGTKGDSKAFVVVIGGDRKEFSAALFVSVEGAIGSEFVHNVGMEDLVGGVSDAEVLFEIGGSDGALTEGCDGACRRGA